MDGDDRRESQLGDGAGFAQETIDVLRMPLLFTISAPFLLEF
jgi:hypothetical protein